MSEYLSTVARSGQVNTPPGSYSTVKEWCLHSFMNPESRVLEIGCSNGFITIETARYTGATCVGVDLHAGSIKAAEQNVDRYVADKVQFQCADAGNLPFEADTFSHVIVSGHLPFVPAELRRVHIIEAMRTLRPWGYMLVALYYYHTLPPVDLIERFNTRIGTMLSVDGDRGYWTDLFDNLPMTMEYEADYEIVEPDSERVEQYVEQLNPDTHEDWRSNLALFIENGRFLSYFVRVYRKLPNDEALMVQIPRGGIYTTRKIRAGHV